MDRYLEDRINARRILLEQIAEIDRLTDEEICEAVSDYETVSLAILALAKRSRVERAFKALEE